VATPILERKGIPAIHFLITDFLAGTAGSRVEEKFKASLLVERLKGQSAQERQDVQAILSQRGYTGGVDEALMAVRLEDASLYDEVAERLGVDLAAFLRRIGRTSPTMRPPTWCGAVSCWGRTVVITRGTGSWTWMPRWTRRSEACAM